MAIGWRQVEHWASGDEYDMQRRRDAWLLESVDFSAKGWALQHRRGGPGKPVTHIWYATEDEARWALAAHLEQGRQEADGADWQRV